MDYFSLFSNQAPVAQDNGGPFRQLFSQLSTAPGLDPRLSAEDATATAEAQVPVMLKNMVQPNPQNWDAAIASMPLSTNVEDRRTKEQKEWDELEARLRARREHLQSLGYRY